MNLEKKQARDGSDWKTSRIELLRTHCRVVVIVLLATSCGISASCTFRDDAATESLKDAFRDAESADITVERNLESAMVAYDVDLASTKDAISRTIEFSDGPYRGGAVALHTDVVVAKLHGADGVSRRVELRGGFAVNFSDTQHTYFGTLKTDDLEKLLLRAAGDRLTEQR
jgi:hypothetical protein